MARKRKTHNFRFQYIGDGPVSSGLVKIGDKADDGVLRPNDEVVVSDPATAEWLRVLSNFREVSSPTSDKATHKPKPKAKGAAQDAPSAPQDAPDGRKGAGDGGSS